MHPYAEGVDRNRNDALLGNIKCQCTQLGFHGVVQTYSATLYSTAILVEQYCKKNF